MTLSSFAITEHCVYLFCVQANAKTHLYDIVIVLLYCQGCYGAEVFIIIIIIIIGGLCGLVINDYV